MTMMTKISDTHHGINSRIEGLKATTSELSLQIKRCSSKCVPKC